MITTDWEELIVSSHVGYKGLLCYILIKWDRQTDRQTWSIVEMLSHLKRKQVWGSKVGLAGSCFSHLSAINYTDAKLKLDLNHI